MKKILTFFIGKSLCGVDLDSVKEISRKVKYTKLIGEDDKLLGLLNLRGQVITLVNLASMVHLTQEAIGDTYCVILKEQQNGGDAVGFFVDKVGEVLAVRPEMCETSPVHSGSGNGYADFVIKLPDQLVLFFDVYKLLECA